MHGLYLYSLKSSDDINANKSRSNSARPATPLDGLSCCNCHDLLLRTPSFRLVSVVATLLPCLVLYSLFKLNCKHFNYFVQIFLFCGFCASKLQQLCCSIVILCINYTFFNFVHQIPDGFFQIFNGIVF